MLHKRSIQRLLVNATEEVDISKLLHLIDITTFRDFLVVEEDPRRRVGIGNLLADERYVMPLVLLVLGVWDELRTENIPCMDRASLVTHYGLKLKFP